MKGHAPGTSRPTRERFKEFERIDMGAEGEWRKGNTQDEDLGLKHQSAITWAPEGSLRSLWLIWKQTFQFGVRPDPEQYLKALKPRLWPSPTIAESQRRPGARAESHTICCSVSHVCKVAHASLKR